MYLFTYLSISPTIYLSICTNYQYNQITQQEIFYLLLSLIICRYFWSFSLLPHHVFVFICLIQVRLVYVRVKESLIDIKTSEGARNRGKKTRKYENNTYDVMKLTRSDFSIAVREGIYIFSIEGTYFTIHPISFIFFEILISICFALSLQGAFPVGIFQPSIT